LLHDKHQKKNVRSFLKERQDVVSEEKYIELRLLARLDETAGIEDKREEKLGKLSLFHK